MNTSLKIIGMLLNSDNIESIHNRVIAFKDGVRISLDPDEMNNFIFLMDCFDRRKDLHVTAHWETATNEG